MSAIENKRLLDAKKDFPIFRKHPNLLYLDSAATSQKPQEVIDALTRFYSEDYASVHRGVYDLSIHATQQYERVRQEVADFLDVTSQEIVFIKGTTDGINLLARAFAKTILKPGDEVILTEMEHHSNLVPWQMLQEEIGIVVKIAPMTPTGEICLASYENLFSPKTRLVSFTHISNVLGTVNPLIEMIEIAKKWKGVLTLIDGAQAVAHEKVSLKEIDTDFYLFSGHKIYGPTGVGVLYGKTHHLEALFPPYGGGSMVKEVTFTKSSYQKSPLKFEAGTPMIAEVIGLGAALRYLTRLGLSRVAEHEEGLIQELIKRLSLIPRIKILGSPKKRGALLSFTIDGIHPLDIATLLNFQEIAIRSGHQCAEPLLQLLGHKSCCRISFGLYNELSDVERVVESLQGVIEELT